MPAISCSSDSHTYEPADLWTTRLPKALRSSAMHWEYVDGGSYGALEGAAVAMKSGEEAKSQMTVSRPLGGDGKPLTGGVEERIKALDSDGVDVEVLLANLGMFMFNMPDGVLAMAHATAYNDYMGETFAKRPDRFVPLAAVPLHDIDWAVKEIERTAKLGLRGAMLPIIVSKSYALEMYEPIWSALEAHNMTATFHAATGFDDSGSGMERQLAQQRNKNPTPAEAVAFRCYSGVEYAQNAQLLISTLVGGGVLERHPKLMVVSAENDAGWLAGLMGTMDHAWGSLIGGPKPALIGRYDPSAGDNQPMMRSMGEMFGKWPYPLKPSEYVRRQVRCTFMDDRMAIACRHITGIETIMWAADYPHPESTYPSSGSIIDNLFEGVPQADRDAIVAGNLAKLYGFEVKTAH